MNIFKLSISNMTSRPLGTLLSILLLMLGVGIISLLLHLGNQVQEQMTRNLRGVDMVVGAKGSPLQLILSSIYHVDAPTGNIPLAEAEKLLKNRLVAYGIPLSYGDSYRGYRIVGTDRSYPELYEVTISKGRYWERSLEVTLGAVVAQKLGLNTGDTFHGAHGLSSGGEIHKEYVYQVVGILAHSNSVIDQLILTSSESVWMVHQHEEHEDHEESEEGHEHHEDEDHGEEHDLHAGNHDHHEDDDHEESREITAMLVRFKNPTAMIQIPRMVNGSTNMQAAIPTYEIQRLFRLMGLSIDVLNVIGIVLLAISGLSIFISLYNALKDRQYELALMRTYGATRWQLVGLVLQEGLLLTVTGFFLGLALSRFGLWLVSVVMTTYSHYALSGWFWIEQEWWLLLMTFIIGLLASLLPAIRAFHLNISKTLADA